MDSGLNPAFLDLVKKDFNLRSDPKEYVWVGIIPLEVSLRKALIFDDSGKLIGFVNLGSAQNSIDHLEQFVFWRIVHCFYGWVFFQIGRCQSCALFNVFWKYVEELEQRDFKVLTSTCDGVSPHRLFYKFHSPLDAPRGTLIYKTRNHFATENRPLYFICDPVHLLKTTRNNWENKTKKLRNNNMLITRKTPLHIFFFRQILLCLSFTN